MNHRVLTAVIAFLPFSAIAAQTAFQCSFQRLSDDSGDAIVLQQQEGSFTTNPKTHLDLKLGIIAARLYTDENEKIHVFIGDTVCSNQRFFNATFPPEFADTPEFQFEVTGISQDIQPGEPSGLELRLQCTRAGRGR